MAPDETRGPGRAVRPVQLNVRRHRQVAEVVPAKTRHRKVPLQKSIDCACRRTGDRAHAGQEMVNSRNPTFTNLNEPVFWDKEQQAAWKKFDNPAFGPASNLAVVHEIILGGVDMPDALQEEPCHDGSHMKFH